MDTKRQELWEVVRRALRGNFFRIVTAQQLDKERTSLPLKDQVNFCPSAEIEKYLKQLSELDAELQREKEIYARKQEEFALRWEQASQRSNALAQALEKFDRLYIACLKKRKQNEVKTAKEMALVEEKRMEVSRLTKEVDRLEKLKVELGVRLDNSRVFREYLVSVKKESEGEFQRTKEVTDRCELLREAHARLLHRHLNSSERVYDEETELHNLKEKAQTLEVASCLYIDEMKAYKEKLEHENVTSEELLSQAKEIASTNFVSVSQTVTAVYNLYVLLCYQMKQPIELEQTSYKAQLKFIKKYLGEMVKVTERVHTALETTSDIVAPSVTLRKKKDITVVRRRKKRPKVTMHRRCSYDDKDGTDDGVKTGGPLKSPSPSAKDEEANALEKAITENHAGENNVKAVNGKGSHPQERVRFSLSVGQ